jgi:hypothetical protein
MIYRTAHVRRRPAWLAQSVWPQILYLIIRKMSSN